MNLEVILDPARGSSGDRVLLVMLPGAGDSADAFARHGFVRALRDASIAADVAMVGANLGHYLERQFPARLARDVIDPARRRGVTRVWLLGISLGGMGALLYARERSAEVTGVVLLAPFLAVRGTIASVHDAGGLAHWEPGEIAPHDDERLLLAWLKRYPGDGNAPRLYLGYGESDRFAPASALLERMLPANHVVMDDGAHDWPTWLRLWTRLLALGIFFESTVDHAQ